MANKKVKKMLALLLAAAMTAGLLGCQKAEQGVPESTEETKTAAYTETEESTFDKPMQNQPETPYWFPADLLEWDRTQDPDFAYNVSSVPLAERVDKSSLAKANDTQNPDMKVVALSIMNSSTSGNAPHGINTVNANVFSYWQYIDTLVYWGGSSGEGIIVAPSADVIDAAHKNGVPVLGTIFFPQTAHGGKIEWLNEFLAKDENGSFPIIAKLIEAAESYGFDGWFINQETDTLVSSFDEAAKGNAETGSAEGGLSKEHAVLMEEFIKAFKAEAADLEIMWYDSMTTEGKMDWQNALTDANKGFMADAEGNPVADSMFLNFWWTNDKYADQELLKASKAKAEEIGVNTYDLYAGIDVQANGIMTPVRWDLFEESAGKSFTSLGLYCPSWTYFSASDMDDFQAKENRLWVNENGNPAEATAAEGTEWRGVSTYAVEQTAITKAPFITNFSLGHGYSFFIDGERVSAMDWNNRSMQDILPTYRWVMEHEDGNDLSASIDYANAYYGGNSVKFRGTLAAGKTSTIKLYSAALPITEETSFTTTAKATADTALELVLTYADGSSQTISGDKKAGKEWTAISYDLKEAAGKTVTAIAYAVSAEEEAKGYELNLGQIAVTEKSADLETKVTEAKVEDTCFDEDDSIYTGVRLSWTPDENAAHYEIYRVNQDETRSFLGATTASTHYLNALQRNDDTNKTNFEIVPVNKNGQRGTASPVVTMDWPDNSIPKANFKVSKTLAAPGEALTFESLCSANTESVSWTFEGADVETSEETAPVVTYANEGVYNVTIKAKNASGEAEFTAEGIVTISSKVSGDLKLLSAGAATEASSFVNNNEAPQFAVDGKTDTKWCATGPAPHEITIDLGVVKAISEVRISHAEAGNESPDMNTKAYTISVSEDGEAFTEAAKITRNAAGTTADTFAAVNARYVKLTVEKPTQGSDTAARIYEVEIYGLDEAL